MCVKVGVNGRKVLVEEDEIALMWDIIISLGGFSSAASFEVVAGEQVIKGGI
jgi:hypothetical protein